MLRHPGSTAASLLLVAALASPGRAQVVEPIVLDEMMVTASRLPVALNETPGSTTILTRDDIEALAATTAAELLRLLPGVHLTGGGGAGTPGFIHTRGADPNLTAVYIDGVRVNDPTDSRGGAFDFQTLDPSEIEKIEIVRGPLSSIHGSSALAGAISITTRKAEDRHLWARAEGGGDNLLRFSAGSSYQGEGWDRQIRFSHSSEGEVVPGNDHLSQSLDLSLSDRGHELSFRYNSSEREGFPESSGGPLFAELRDVEREESDQLQLSLRSTRVLPRGSRVGISVSGFQKDNLRESPGIANAQPASESDGRYRRGEVEVSFRAGDSIEEVVLGGVLSSELGDTEGMLFDAPTPFGPMDLPTDFRLHRRVGSLYTEGIRHHRLLTVQTSLRLDAPDGGEKAWSPRFGVRHRLKWGEGSLKANWGKSFKLASLYALGDPLVGDPGLKNETSRGWDVAWVQPLLTGRIELELGYFESRYEELIEFDFDSFRLVNLSEVDISGVELAMHAQPTRKVRVEAQLSQSRSEIRGSGDALEDRPEWTASLHGRWNWKEGHSVGVNVLHVGKVPDTSSATGFVELDSYTRVDLTAHYELAHHWSAVFALENLFDAGYEEAVGFESHGLRPRLGISYR